MNNEEENELDRIQEQELGDAMKANGPSQDFARQTIYRMISRLADDAMDMAIRNRRNIQDQKQTVSGAFHAYFNQNLHEFADAILLTAQTALTWTSDPFAALHELREPERLAEQKARASALVAERSAALSKELDGLMSKKRAEMLEALNAEYAHFAPVGAPE